MFDKKVFISHSSKNKEIADHLCAYIARLGVKEKNIFCSSVVGQGIGNGEKLNNAIAYAIQDSSLLIFLLSYDFINSSYCMEELGVGWYLSQRNDVTCYYLVLPDIEMSELIGFVNSKSDKFTFLDLEHREELSALSCDLANQMNIRMKAHTVITNAENVFLSSIRSSIEEIFEARKARERLQEGKENERTQLNDTILHAKNEIDSLKHQLDLSKQHSVSQDATIELRTIENILEGLSYTDYKPKNALDSLEKDFWFELINRYFDLLSQLELSPTSSRAEMVIAYVYLSIGDIKNAYEHFVNHITLLGKNTSEYDLTYFAQKFSVSMQDIINKLQAYHASEREGLCKDGLFKAITLLKKREELLNTGDITS